MYKTPLIKSIYKRLWVRFKKKKKFEFESYLGKEKRKEKILESYTSSNVGLSYCL